MLQLFWIYILIYLIPITYLKVNLGKGDGKGVPLLKCSINIKLNFMLVQILFKVNYYEYITKTSFMKISFTSNFTCFIQVFSSFSVGKCHRTFCTAIMEILYLVISSIINFSPLVLSAYRSRVRRWIGRFLRRVRRPTVNSAKRRFADTSQLFWKWQIQRTSWRLSIKCSCDLTFN